MDPAATCRRLASFIGAEGYKPDVLARVARLSVELRETVQAGRYWLLSDATGSDVDAAVEAFAESCQRTPRLMVSELPRFARDWDVDAYPAPARARIGKYRLADDLARRRPRQQPQKKPMTTVALLVLAALLLFAAALILLRR
ncbi:MAG: DUF6584 family protein [Myxococcales bacterium]